MPHRMPMDKNAAIQQIREACDTIARQLMRIHPALPSLADKEAQEQIIKTAFEMTKQVETIKKRLARLDSKDDSPLT